MAVPAARRIPDCQCEGGPAALFSDWETHLRETRLRAAPSEPHPAEAKGRIRTMGCLDRDRPPRLLATPSWYGEQGPEMDGDLPRVMG